MWRVQVHPEDEQCARVAKGPTLFYMPHCVTSGFCNLLRANADCLDRVAILGNSFQGYQIRWNSIQSMNIRRMEYVPFISNLASYIHAMLICMT